MVRHNRLVSEPRFCGPWFEGKIVRINKNAIQVPHRILDMIKSNIYIAGPIPISMRTFRSNDPKINP